MAIRPTILGDLPAIETLYAEAKAALREMNIDQWQTGDYPNSEDARIDMKNGSGFVYEEDGAVLGVACIDFGHEPTYDKIDGAWGAQPETYGFLHRIAVSGAAKGKGIAGKFFAELERQANEKGIAVLRADTHEKNLPMQRVLQKAGFTKCGVIWVEDGTPRYAFEKILD